LSIRIILALTAKLVVLTSFDELLTVFVPALTITVRAIVVSRRVRVSTLYAVLTTRRLLHAGAPGVNCFKFLAERTRVEALYAVAKSTDRHLTVSATVNHRATTRSASVRVNR
jgi:hypothetical protein